MKDRHFELGLVQLAVTGFVVTGLPGYVTPSLAGDADPRPEQTHILFPFVTNQAGFDTGIFIDNTSKDPYGTSPVGGACILNFYGSGAPTTPLNTGTISPGTVYNSLASVIAPGFQGYIIADCSFTLAHGGAFITNVSANHFSTLYLGLIIQTQRNNDLALPN